MQSLPYIVHRSKDGLKIITPFKGDSICTEETFLAKVDDPRSNRVEGACCSEDGEYIAWCDNKVIKCLRLSTQETVFEQPNIVKSNCIMISPKSTKLVTFNTMSGGDNLQIYNVATQEKVLSIPWRKASEWRPFFSMNEDICLQHRDGDLLLYAGGKFDKPKLRIGHLKVTGFSLSTASIAPSQAYQHIYEKRIKNKNHYLAIYTKGSKGQPSIVKIYKYPNLTDAVTNKSFFKADSVKFCWSPSGTSLLLICATDFDQTGKSYYGEQSLNFMNVKGDSFFVKLPKEGSISHIEWHPSCDQELFVCVYGLQPARVSLFNNKCEIVHNFGDEGSYNGTLFSPFGNLLAIYGFGNLGGGLNVWDFDKKKLVASLKVPDSTGIDWCADGKHIVTCTTSPRLRVGNGYRLWHYSGSLMYELVGPNDPMQNLEIFEVIWQPAPGKFAAPKLDAKNPKIPNLMSKSNLSKFQNSAAKYVPPSERNKARTASERPKYLDSAIGIGAGGREIVGLESMSLNNQPKKKPTAKNKTSVNAGNATTNNNGNNNNKTKKGNSEQRLKSPDTVANSAR